MLNQNRFAQLLLPAMLCLCACSAHEVRDDADASAARQTATTEDPQQTRRIDALTSDHAELLHRRNGIESEPGRHQPTVEQDPGR